MQSLLLLLSIPTVINIEFSDVLTICNINGVPCLSFRLGNADGHANPLTDINVRLTYSYGMYSLCAMVVALMFVVVYSV